MVTFHPESGSRWRESFLYLVKCGNPAKAVVSRTFNLDLLTAVNLIKTIPPWNVQRLAQSRHDLIGVP